MDMDRIKAALLKLVRLELARFDYFALYACTVVEQRADGALGLRPDRPGTPAPTGVRIRGLPGVTVKVAPGARVLLGYEGGDPRRPYAALFEESGLVEFTITASVKVSVSAPLVVLSEGGQPVARVGDAVTVVGSAGPWPFIGTATITSGNAKVIT